MYIAMIIQQFSSSYRQRADGPQRLSVSLPPKWTANYRTAIHAVNIKTIGCTCQREQYGGRFGSKLTHIVKFLSQTVFRKSVIFYRFSFVCLNKCQTGFYVSNEITRVRGKIYGGYFSSCIVGISRSKWEKSKIWPSLYVNLVTSIFIFQTDLVIDWSLLGH